MTSDEIIRQLQRVPDKCDFTPYETALLAATLQRDVITPELIAAIDRVSANPAHYLKDHEDCLHLFAIYLLAQFRERRALEAFLRFFSLPDDQSLELTGDMVTEHGAAIFVSVCGGDPAPLLRLARDESVNEFVRGQAIDGLLVQAGWRERPREAVVEDLRQLFQTLPKPGDPYVWAEWICAVHDFDAAELLPEARRAFAEQLVDESVIGLEDVDPGAPRGPQRYPQPSGEERFRSFLERNSPIDAVAECSIWQCFHDNNAPADFDDDDVWDGLDVGEDERPNDLPDLRPERFSYSSPADAYELPPVPFVAPPKVGRNETCPCGSGKKFKKCCGKN